MHKQKVFTATTKETDKITQKMMFISPSNLFFFAEAVYVRDVYSDQ